MDIIRICGGGMGSDKAKVRRHDCPLFVGCGFEWSASCAYVALVWMELV